MNNKIKSIIRSKLSKHWHRREFLRNRTALVLSGGGAKSFCQIGVLKVLEREKIPIDLIVGCSMGAVIGALFSIGTPVAEIERRVLDFCQLKQVKDIEKQFISEAIGIRKIGEFMRDLSLYIIDSFKGGIWPEDNLIENLSTLISPHLTFNDVNIPFACVATDVKEGKRILLHEGNLLRSVAASSSIPGIFTPVKDNGRILVDGGVLSRMPITAAEKMKADFIIAIFSGSSSRKEPSNALETLFKTIEIRELEFARLEASLADFLFSPPIGEWSWFSFSKTKEIIGKGEEEAKKKVAYLKKIIKKTNIEKKKRRKLFLPLFYQEDI